MSETPKFKSGVGGSRGLANLLRQHSSNPNAISGFISSDTSTNWDNSTDRPKNLPFSSPTFRKVVEDASKFKGGRELSPTPDKRSLTPPPPPRKPMDLPLTQSSTLESPRLESTAPRTASTAAEAASSTSTSSVSNVESTVIKNATFNKPLPPTASKASKSPTVIEHVPLSELSISSAKDVDVVPVTHTPAPPPKPTTPPRPPNPTARTEAVKQSATIDQSASPTATIASTKSSPAPSTSTPSTRKGNVTIGAKAGGVYAEASYVGDGDEVDDSEW